jgi:hypothetical protein
MNDEVSSQATELNSDHHDVNPSHGAGLGGFVITDQSPVVHQPTEGALHDPAPRQDFEPFVGIRAFDDLDGQPGAEALDPLGESLTGVTTIYPQNSQPSEPAQHSPQKQLSSVAFGGVGRSHGHIEDQPQSIHQQMAFATFDALGGVIADLPAVPSGLDALTVQDGRSRPAALVVGAAHEDAQGVVDHGPLMVGHPLPEDVINRFPVRKVGGQIAPGTAAFGQIEDGLKDTPPIGGRASAFGGFGKQGFKVSPLGVGQVRVVSSGFHRLKSAAAKVKSKKDQSNQAISPIIFTRRFTKPKGFSFSDTLLNKSHHSNTTKNNHE